MKGLRMLGLSVCTLGALVLAGASTLSAGGKGAGPKVGDKAPTFTSTDEQGKPWKSADHVGKKIVVLYFYPADFTGGCTKQACGFRDDLKPLTAKGVEVVGISGDTVETHAKFKKHHNLNFTLLADSKGEVARKFGIPVKGGGKAKGPAGEQLLRDVTILRWTVVIDKGGNIAARYQVADAEGDSKKVLETVEKLQK